MTKIVNIKFEPYDVYIGRAGHGLDGYFGNEHPVYQEGKPWTECKICKKKHKRGEALAAYKIDFDKRIREDSEFKKKVLKLKDKRLGCFCVPFNKCHGEIIKNFLDSQSS